MVRVKPWLFIYWLSLSTNIPSFHSTKNGLKTVETSSYIIHFTFSGQ